MTNFCSLQRFFFVLMVFIAATSSSFAQNASVHGRIVDTLNNIELANTVISISNTKDSALYKFVRSKTGGEFEMNNLAAGKYILLVSYPSYVDYVDTVILSENTRADIGKINLLTKSHLLEEVVVKQTIAAIRMRGDTVEFKADSFKVAPGANVEDLLKRLPGLQVDKDGNISALGQKVEKVLVDGEEFFGNDPTIATKNLQASAVDKVQVFDKKSDQAAFTGIDDGQTQKTVNLKLKENAKKGYFGKLDLNGGFDDKWNNSAMFNRFRAKQKFSVYGVMSSTGKTGLNWEEANQYGGGSGNVEYSDDGGMSVYWSGDDFSSGRYYGQGLPKSWATGTNYSNKFDEDKHSINGSYRYNKLNSESAGRTVSQNILHGSELITHEESANNNNRQRHSANATYEWQIDSTTSVKITANGYTELNKGYSHFYSETHNGSDSLINKNNRYSTSDGDNKNMNTNMVLRKKFKKTGRTFSLNLSEQYNAGHSTGFLNADVTTFDVNRTPKDSLTSQLKENDNKFSAFSVRTVYTEPLAKDVFGELSYAFRNNLNNSEKLSYDKASDGKFEIPNEKYSSQYKYDIYTNTVGASLRYNGKKLNASIGSDVAFQDYNQKNVRAETSLSTNYTNLFPRANIGYKFSGNFRLSLRYNGSTQQPSITQIQPVADNTNPMIEWKGNDKLKQSFRHNIGFNINSYNILKQRGVYSYGGINVNSNAIVNNQYTDISTGKTTYQYINISGNYNMYMGAGYNFKIKKINLSVDINPRLNLNRTKNFINDLLNITNSYNPSIDLDLYTNKDKKYNLWCNSNFTYNYSKSTINTGIKTNYWTQYYGGGGTVQLPYKMEISADVNFRLRQKTEVFDKNNNTVIINGYIGRKLLKNDKAMFKIGVNDLLDQKRGFDRYINSATSSIQENTYDTIAKYFYLGFTWNFSKNPGQ